jgi:hypothetical protein
VVVWNSLASFSNLGSSNPEPPIMPTLVIT